jgi:hypothetical protein
MNSFRGLEMFLSWRSGDVRAYGVSGDDPRKGRFEDPRKDSRALNPNILGPIFTPKSVFGRFLVGLGPRHRPVHSPFAVCS